MLLDDEISRKGNAGDVIEVRPGYARNKLIPQKLAKYATPENVAKYVAIQWMVSAVAMCVGWLCVGVDCFGLCVVCCWFD